MARVVSKRYVYDSCLLVEQTILSYYYYFASINSTNLSSLIARILDYSRTAIA